MKTMKNFLAGTLCAIMILENAISVGFQVSASENVQLESTIEEGTENSEKEETIPLDEEATTETEGVRTEEEEETESYTNSEEAKTDETKSEEVTETEYSTESKENKTKTAIETEEGQTDEESVETESETASETEEISDEDVEAAGDGEKTLNDGSSVEASGKCGDNLTWTLKDGTLTISGTGDMYNYGILWNDTKSAYITAAPWGEYYNYNLNLVILEGITKIGRNAFSGCNGFVGSLIIPDSVTNIDEYAFDGCSGFTGNLIIGNRVINIGDSAFSGCNGFTGSLIISNSVTSIGNWAFGYCSGFIGSLTIGNGVTSIGEFAFDGCSGFTGNLTIGNGVTNIGGFAFYGCSSFTGNLIIPDSVINVGESAFGYCSGFTGNLTIGNGVTDIGGDAFRYCSGFAGNLTIGNRVINIGEFAFEECSNFTGNLTIPDSVIKIGDMAFENCSGFTGNLTIGNNITSIESSTFSGCSGFAGRLIIPDSVTNIDHAAFRGCSSFTGNLTIPNKVTNIGVEAFKGCIGFTGNLTIPNSVTSIGHSAFEGCSGFTGSLTISDSVTSIGQYAFRGCDGFTGSLTIGNGITSISNEFEGCKGFKGNLIIGKNVTSIGDNAFRNCSSFTGSLVIPDNVTNIGAGAFYCCSGFTGSLTIPDSVTYMGSKYEYDYNAKGAFEGCSGFTGSLTIGNGITSIRQYAFKGCSGFTGSLVIPDSVTIIYEGAFENCSGFTGNLIIPSSVTSIRQYAFKGCSGFTGSLMIPDSVTWIGWYAFENCSGFTGNLTIPSSVATIGAATFKDCSGFTGKLTLGKKIQTIGSSAFSGCTGLTGGIQIPDSVTSIGSDAFRNCSGFTGKLTLGKKIQTIGSSAFSGCTGLTGDIQIPDSVTSIGEEAFSGCTNLSGNFYIPPSVKTIGKNAFASAKMICGERGSYAETYAKNNSITFKTIDELQQNSEDIKAESGEVVICAIDSKTNGVIPFSTISIDGTKYKTGFDGTLRVTTVTGKHIVWAGADGYIAMLAGTEENLRPGIVIKIYLDKPETTDYEPEYLAAKLTGASEDGGIISFNGEVYSVYGPNRDEIFKGISERNMVGKTVIITMQNNVVTKVELLSDCIVPVISMIPKTPSISYSKGKYSQKEVETKVLIDCGIKKPYPQNFLQHKNDAVISLKNVKLSSENDAFEFKEGKWIESGSPKFEQSVNRDISSAESYEFTVLLCPNKKFVPDKVSCDVAINIETAYARKDDNIERSDNTRGSMHLNNLDMQEPESGGEQQEKIEKLRNDIKSNTLVSLAELDSLYDTDQRKQMEEFLTVWIADITMAMDEPYKRSRDDEARKILLSKMGVDIENFMIYADKKTATVTVEAKTIKHGKKKVIYTLEIVNYHLGESKPYGSLGSVSWEIDNPNGIFPSRGTCAIVQQANVDSFAEQLKSIALGQIKGGYNEFWGKGANEVASLFIDKTIMKVIDKRYGSFSNMVFKLVTLPTDMHIKTISKCPVDIYVYNNKDVLCGAIVDNKVYNMNNEVSMYVDEQQAKYVTYCENEYYLKFVGTDTGSMNHYIEEYADIDECVRTISYENVPLTDDTVYYEDIPSYLYADNDIYALISEEGETVDSDSDTYQDNIEPFIFVDGINMEETKAELKVGVTKKLTANLVPANATNKGILWESRDESVATVDSEGVVTAVSEGSTAIVAISVDGRYESTCDIVVGEAEKDDDNKDDSNKDDDNNKDDNKGDDNNKDDNKDDDNKDDDNKDDNNKDDDNSSDDSSYPAAERQDLSALNASIAGIRPQTYNRDEQEPVVKITAFVDGRKTTLIEGMDYRVSYKNNIDAGTATIIIKGNGAYKGTLTQNFTIRPKSLKKLKVVAGALSENASGSDLSAYPIHVYDGAKRLNLGTDYTLSSAGMTKNAVKVSITGKGNYTGTAAAKLSVYNVSNDHIINPDNVRLDKDTAAYTGKPVKTVNPIVTVSGSTLTLNQDYKVQYQNNTNAGTAYVIVTGKGAYRGRVVLPFEIQPVSASAGGVTIKPISAKTYNGKLQKPAVSVTASAGGKTKKLVKNKDYKVTYKNNLHAGTATVMITGKGNYAGVKAQTQFTIEPQSIAKAAVKGTQSSLQLTYNKRLLKQGVHYEAPSYGGSTKNKVQVTIKGKGDFTGQITKYIKK